MSAFDGFPEESLDFYEGLAADPSKAYWLDHKPVYDRAIDQPMRALLAELEPEFGPGKFFRPYRDVRFSKDKNPYKLAAAASASDAGTDGQGALYLELSADGLFLAGGFWLTTTDQAQRLRAATADPRTGPALVRALNALTGKGFEVAGEQLKRLPSEFPDDHPRVALLRHKSLTASRRYTPEPWLHTAEARDRIAQAWRDLAPLNRWLARHVGAPTSRRETRAEQLSRSAAAR